MKKFSRAALLKKKRWTGEDVGQAYIYNLSIQAPGKAAEPIESATLRDKAAGLDFEQFSLYREYMNVYNWLLSEFSMDILNKDLVSQNEAQNPLMSSLFLFLIE